MTGVVLFVLWHFPAHAQSAAAAAEPALVTFYSSGKFLVAPWSRHGKFIGRVMDTEGQLAMLQPGRFVTFRFDPGDHRFAANSWMLPTTAGGGSLTLHLVAGKHYFVGAYLNEAGIPTMFRLEERPCEIAVRDNSKALPLESSHLREYGAAHLVVESSFAACP